MMKSRDMLSDFFMFRPIPSVCLWLYKFPCFWTSSSAGCIQGDKLLDGANSNAIKKKRLYAKKLFRSRKSSSWRQFGKLHQNTATGAAGGSAEILSL